MDLSRQKEQFSIAYAKAVAATAGCSADEPSVDIDSVDIVITRAGGDELIVSPRLDVQLKCTSRDVLKGDDVTFELGIKNYNDLRREKSHVPRILLVVLVPQDLELWIKQDETALAMSHCGYWRSLRGHPATANVGSVTVPVPRSQTFTVAALTAMLDRIAKGGLP